MAYKLPWSLRIYNVHDHVATIIERIVLCDIRRRHHVKMGSYPRCYRCSRVVFSGTEQWKR
jgi:hypothetical protein